LKEVVSLTNGKYSCEVLASYGAALNSYQFQGVEFIAGYTDFSETITQKYRGVVLAPFPNRTAEGKYSFLGKEFSLPINRPKEALALHGFLYDKTFVVLNQTKSKVVLQYNYNASLKAFPFSFTLTVSYEILTNGVLSITTEVENTGLHKMPFGSGWHPYFKIDECIDGMFLQLPACKKMELKNNIPTEKIQHFLEEETTLNLANYHFDDCFIFNQNQVNIKLIGDEYLLKINAKGQDNYPFFQIYTPKDRASIAIEPMTCAPNAFNNKIGLIELEANEKASFCYNILAEIK